MGSQKATSSSNRKYAGISMTCIAFLFFCFACAVQQEIKKSDRLKFHLKGNIKSVRQIPEYIYTTQGTYLIGEPWPYSENNSFFLFNENGNLIEKRLYLTNGQNYLKETYFYDENNKLIKQILYNLDGSIGSRIFYSYDKNGKIEESECINYLGVKFIYKYVDGNRTEAYKYYGDGNLYFKANYRYDKKGNCIEEKVFTPEKKLFSKWLYTYDEKQNRIVKERYLPNNKLDCKITYKYDENRKKTHWKNFGPNGKLESEGTYSYLYDSLGNWIKKVKLENSEPIYILKREIEYFE